MAYCYLIGHLLQTRLGRNENQNAVYQEAWVSSSVLLRTLAILSWRNVTTRLKLLESCLPVRVDGVVVGVVPGLRSPPTRLLKKHDRRKVRQGEASLQPSCIRFSSNETAQATQGNSMDRKRKVGGWS